MPPVLKAISRLWQKAVKRLVKTQLAEQKKLRKKVQKKLFQPALPAVKKKMSVQARPSAASGDGATPKPKLPEPPAAVPTPALGANGSWKRAVFSAVTDIHGKPHSLSYWLFLPARPEGKLPLVVMLHGCDQDAPDFATGTRMNALAARYGFAVLYPQQSARTHAQRCWPWYKRGLQHGGGEAALIAGIIDVVIARCDIDRSRIYAAGLSAGAALAQILALRSPHLFAAIGSHSGPVYGMADSRLSAFAVMQKGSVDAGWPIRHLLGTRSDFPEMPIMILQGLQDNVVRPINASQLVQQFCLLNRLAASSEQTPVQHSVRGARDAYATTDYLRGRVAVVRLCQVTHLAHAWSGGDPALRYNAAAGPDASALLWDFFKRHRRLPGRASCASHEKERLG